MMTIALHISELEPYRPELFTTEFSNWSEKLKQLAFNKPLFQYRLTPDALKIILLQNTAYRKYAKIRKKPAPLLIDTPEQLTDAFPKLGVMSWKELPGMTFWPKGVSGNTLSKAWLSNITSRMASVLHAWVETDRDTFFYLYPYHDLTDAVELRFYVDKENSQLIEKSHNGCFNDQHIALINVIDFITVIKKELVLGAYYIDIVIVDGEIHLLEINPVIH